MPSWQHVVTLVMSYHGNEILHEVMATINTSQFLVPSVNIFVGTLVSSGGLWRPTGRRTVTRLELREGYSDTLQFSFLEKIISAYFSCWTCAQHIIFSHCFSLFASSDARANDAENEICAVTSSDTSYEKAKHLFHIAITSERCIYF